MEKQKAKAKKLVEISKDFVHGYVGSSMLTNHEYPDAILENAKKLAHKISDEVIYELSDLPRKEVKYEIDNVTFD